MRAFLFKNGLSRHLSSLLNDYADKTEAVRIALLERQIVSVIGTIPMVIATNVLSVLILLGLDFGTPHFSTALAIFTPLLIGLFFLFNNCRKFRKNRPSTVSELLEVRYCLIRQALVRGSVWGVYALAVFPQVDIAHQSVIAMLMLGMMSGGALGLAAVPAAAGAFVVPMTVGGSISLAISGVAAYIYLSFMMLLFCGFLIQQSTRYHRRLVSGTLREVTSREQGETIRLLLKDFEENSSDWLWQTDINECIVSPSSRFQQAAAPFVEHLAGTPIGELISNDDEGLNIPVLAAIYAGQPIKEAVVSLGSGQARRYWSLTGKPKIYKRHQSGYRGVATDVTDKVLGERRLRLLAHTDVLTGLYNRNRYTELLAEIFDWHTPSRVGMIIVDLDGFKTVNDTLGHGVGDVLLRQIGERLEGLSADNLFIGRLGGDEFALIVTGVGSIDTLEELSAEIVSVLCEPYDVSPHMLQVGACAGYALGGGGILTPTELMRSADIALYAAKAEGRGRWKQFHPEMAEAHQRRRIIEASLRRAVEHEELEIFYQPIVTPSTGRIHAYEALLRWTSSEFGAVSPAEFIPIAEESGLIVPLGEWVLNRALADASQWSEDIAVCINVSPQQMRQSTLCGTVVGLMQEYGLSADRVVVEITEGVFLDDTENVVRVIDGLVGAGIKVALDDFGTGYSSLSYLRRFPFSEIKIDKSFVDDIEHDPVNRSLVKTIIEMANALGFEVVAEGVETPAQLAALTELGCDYVQGYLMARPMGASDLDFSQVMLPVARNRRAVG